MFCVNGKAHITFTVNHRQPRVIRTAYFIIRQLKTFFGRNAPVNTVITCGKAEISARKLAVFKITVVVSENHYIFAVEFCYACVKNKC